MLCCLKILASFLEKYLRYEGVGRGVYCLIRPPYLTPPDVAGNIGYHKGRIVHWRGIENMKKDKTKKYI